MKSNCKAEPKMRFRGVNALGCLSLSTGHMEVGNDTILSKIQGASIAIFELLFSSPYSLSQKHSTSGPSRPTAEFSYVFEYIRPLVSSRGGGMFVEDVLRATARFRRLCRPTFHDYATHDFDRDLRGRHPQSKGFHTLAFVP